MAADNDWRVPYLARKKTIPRGVSKSSPLGNPGFYFSHKWFIDEWLGFMAGQQTLPVIERSHSTHRELMGVIYDVRMLSRL